MEPVRITWPGGEHGFRMRIGELRALQQARGAGPEEIFNRLRAGSWHVDDIVQVLRYGLAGGGNVNPDGKPMTAADAATLVTPLIDLHPLVDFKLPALAVLGASLLGPDPDDPVGEDAGATETPLKN